MRKFSVRRVSSGSRIVATTVLFRRDTLVETDDGGRQKPQKHGTNHTALDGYRYARDRLSTHSFRRYPAPQLSSLCSRCRDAFDNV